MSSSDDISKESENMKAVMNIQSLLWICWRIPFHGGITQLDVNARITLSLPLAYIRWMRSRAHGFLPSLAAAISCMPDNQHL